MSQEEVSKGVCPRTVSTSQRKHTDLLKYNNIPEWYNAGREK